MQKFNYKETLSSAKMNTMVDELNGKQEKITDLADIRSNATSGASAASAIASMFGDLVAIVYVEEEPANPAANTIYLIKEED